MVSFYTWFLPGYIKEPMFEIDKGLYQYYKIFQIFACYD